MQFKIEQITEYKKYILIVSLIVLAAALAFWGGIFYQTKRNQTRVDALQRAYLENQDKLIALSEDRALKLKEVAKLRLEVSSLQKKNDEVIREVPKSAFKKVYYTSSDIDPMWDKFLIDVRERNRQRSDDE